LHDFAFCAKIPCTDRVTKTPMIHGEATTKLVNITPIIFGTLMEFDAALAKPYFCKMDN